MPDLGVISSNSDQIRDLLDEEGTVFLVFANTPNGTIQPLYDMAIRVAQANNPNVWRVLWVEQPHQLDQELTSLFWDSEVDHAIVLSLGAGMNRTVNARYANGNLTGAFDIFDAFSQG